MSICDHVRLLNPEPSPGVLAGGCDLYRCSRCATSWMMYRKGDELVVDGQRPDGELFELRYPMSPVSHEGVVGMVVECAYCRRDVWQTVDESPPPVWDDRAWDFIAAEHSVDCEWVTTRAHTREAAV